jgi:hypothetical protein
VTPAIDLYRSAVDAVHSEVRNALANWGIVQAANREARLVGRISGTLHSGDAAVTILNSCSAAALLAAARLWDDDARPPLCKTVANPLVSPERGYAIASLLHSAGVSAPDAESRIKAFGKCAKRQRRRAVRGHDALSRLRNQWLAHRQVSPPADGGAHYHADGGAEFPTLDFLNLVYRAHLIASGAARLLDPNVVVPSFRTLRADFIKNGNAFWATYVSAPRAMDDFGRPV